MKEAFPGRHQAKGTGAEQPAIWGTTQDCISSSQWWHLRLSQVETSPKQEMAKTCGWTTPTTRCIPGHLSGCIIVFWDKSIINSIQATDTRVLSLSTETPIPVNYQQKWATTFGKSTWKSNWHSNNPSSMLIYTAQRHSPLLPPE